MNLYHYTDLNAVHSILDTHKIRMTDIRFLNDKKEYLMGLEILEEASYELQLEEDYYDKGFIDDVQQWLEKAFIDLSDLDNASEMFYVASFSHSSDILSQWRSYGMFAIEFERDKLEDGVRKWAREQSELLKKPLPLELIECEYVLDKNDSIEVASELICKKVIDTIYDFWQKNVPAEENLHLYRDLREIISMLATTFKHESFNEEAEVRLVVSDKIVSKQIKFRTKNSVLIPYYELEVSNNVISGVKIGPVEDQKITEQSLQIYNSHRAAKLGGDGYLLNIETSDIPYRTL